MSEKKVRFPSDEKSRIDFTDTKVKVLEIISTDTARVFINLLITVAGGYLVLKSIAEAGTIDSATNDYRIYIGAFLLLLNLWLDSPNQGTDD